MKHLELVKTVKKRFAKIDDALKNVVKDFDANDIHLFRIEVKKLRSFLRLVSAGGGKHSRQKLPNKLYGFYCSIGVIRNLQIQKKNIEELDNPEYSSLTKYYLDYIHNKIGRHIEELRTFGKGKRQFSKGRQEIIKNLPSRLKLKSIRKFTGDKLKTLTNLMKPSSLSDESLHSVRKTLKDILYTWSYTNEKTAIPSVVVMSKKDIRSITTLLGNFQDKCVGLDLLHAHYKKQLTNLNERLVWRKLENKLWNEKESDRENIHKVFQKEFHLQHDQLQSSIKQYLPLVKKQLVH